MALAQGQSQGRVSSQGKYAGYAPKLYDGFERTSVHVPVRDDTRLAVDVWGVAEGVATVSRLLKTTMDPAGVLNAGRGPV